MLSITSRFFFGENSDCYALAYEVTHMRIAQKSAGTILAAIVKAVRMDSAGYFGQK